MARKVEALERIVHILNDDESLDVSGMGTAELINQIAAALEVFMRGAGLMAQSIQDHERRIKALEGNG